MSKKSELIMRCPARQALTSGRGTHRVGRAPWQVLGKRRPLVSQLRLHHSGISTERNQQQRAAGRAKGPRAAG